MLLSWHRWSYISILYLKTDKVNIALIRASNAGQKQEEIP